MPSKLRFASPFRKKGISSPVKIGASTMERALRKEFGNAIPPFKRLGNITVDIEITVTPIFQNTELTLVFPKDHHPNVVLVITAADKASKKIRITDAQFSKAIKLFLDAAPDAHKPEIILRLQPPRIQAATTKAVTKAVTKAPSR